MRYYHAVAKARVRCHYFLLMKAAWRQPGKVLAKAECSYQSGIKIILSWSFRVLQQGANLSRWTELKKLCRKVKQSSCFHSGMCCCGLEKILWGFPSTGLRPSFCLLWTSLRVLNIPKIKCRESSTIWLIIFVLKNVWFVHGLFIEKPN